MLTSTAVDQICRSTINILPVAEAMFQSPSSGIDRAVRPQQDTNAVLLILSIEQLLVQLRTRDPVPVKSPAVQAKERANT